MIAEPVPYSWVDQVEIDGWVGRVQRNTGEFGVWHSCRDGGEGYMYPDVCDKCGAVNPHFDQEWKADTSRRARTNAFQTVRAMHKAKKEREAGC